MTNGIPLFGGSSLLLSLDKLIQDEMAISMLFPAIISISHPTFLFTVPPKCLKFRRISLSFLHSTSLFPSSASPPAAAGIRLDALGYRSGVWGSRKKRLVVAGAGPPSTSNYIFAFIFPLSLLAVTIFTSIRIADKLDQEYLEELAINEAIMEEEDEDGDVLRPMDEEPKLQQPHDLLVREVDQEPALPRSRNRPKREI